MLGLRRSVVLDEEEEEEYEALLDISCGLVRSSTGKGVDGGGL